MDDALRNLERAVKEQVEEGSGFWRSCSGCYDTEDGRPTGHYPHSKTFECALGSGCGECGGLGAVWDNTDYADMADWMQKRESEPRCDHCGAHESDWQTK